jgi:2',5'-phosphodiesterase
MSAYQVRTYYVKTMHRFEYGTTPGAEVGSTEMFHLKNGEMALSVFALLSLCLSFHSIYSYSTSMNPSRVRIVSYNVLSSHLARTDHYPTLNPSHLLASNRLPVVLKKLDEEVEKKSIICLQEVSQDWEGELHTYFANRGYYLVSGLYGKKFNGYMGCILAWPTDSMNVLKVDISRLSDKRQGGWPKGPKKGTVSKIISRIVSAVRQPLENSGWLQKPPIDHWSMAQNRFNILLSVQLQEKQSGRSYFVSTYHMPCAFYAPMVMTLHAEMAAKHVQTLAGDCPYILAGDWNFKPYDSAYSLLTTGMMDLGHPDWPTPKHGMEWMPTSKPMRSAYAETDHGEPDFTNYARAKEDDPFIDTLDYIFCSNQWNIDGVKALPTRDQASGPFPNLDVSEPSDHILVAADLSLQ